MSQYYILQKTTPKKYTFSEWFFLMLFYHIFRILQGVFHRFPVQLAQRIEDSHKVYFFGVAFYSFYISITNFSIFSLSGFLL